MHINFVLYVRIVNGVYSTKMHIEDIYCNHIGIFRISGGGGGDLIRLKIYNKHICD